MRSPDLGAAELAARCGIDSGREIDWMGVTLQEGFSFLSECDAEIQTVSVRPEHRF